MRPRLGVTLPLRPLLDPVVADGRGRVERIGHVLAGDVLDETGVERVPDPQAGVTVGLQFDAHLTPSLRPCRGLCSAAPRSGSGLMPVLVREDVRLREWAAACSEL